MRDGRNDDLPPSTSDIISSTISSPSHLSSTKSILETLPSHNLPSHNLPSHDHNLSHNLPSHNSSSHFHEGWIRGDKSMRYEMVDCEMRW